MCNAFRFAVILMLAATTWAGEPAVGTAIHPIRWPGSLDDTIISESFDDTPAGQLPPGWTQTSIDTGSNSGILHGPTVWQAISRAPYSTHTGGGTAINAFNDNGSSNDDWLILPTVPALLAPIRLSLWASSHNATYLENFEIRVSTASRSVADFTNLIRSQVQTPRLWTQYTDNLDAFAGDSFYVAIRYTSHDRYALKIDDVTLTGTRIVAVDPLRPDLPETIAFHGNYPNPFNSETVFRFSLPRAAATRLVIYNALGQQSAVAVDGLLPAGDQAVLFNAAALPSGLYFAQLTALGQSTTHKVILLK